MKPTTQHIAKVGLAVFICFLFLDVSAQCVMCKAVAEDSAAAGAVGRGINQGILYIMAVPYILLGIIGFLIVKKWKLVE